MEPPRITMLLVYLLGFLSLVNGFVIDKSCKEVEGQISKAAELAFKRASIAHDALAKSPLDGDIQDLAKLLFSPSTFGKAKGYHPTYVYGGIGSMAFELPSGLTPPKQDVTIFCTYDHLKKEKVKVKDDKGNEVEKEAWVDKGQTPEYKFFADKLEECNLPNGGASNTMALTLKQALDPKRPASQERRAFIQLCPWYLNKLTGSKFPHSGKIDFWGKIGSALDKVVDTKTEMDTLALLEHTLLHEFSHTPLGGRTEDYEYEWKPCTGLGDKGYNNADSIAFFAQGVELIRKGLIPQKNGKIVKKTNKRDLVASAWAA
ncbi:hypothetical protein N7492_005146 [Penicillium capsulatum]|uniref:Lysine-specific metallo-endopeptidase domain-containing protein n=1 Tax=Penicillium capsulatum TaxID=69766 RepID=A0A9W9LRU5_9EURO|nr:hypothetical protein N7492_005146 [Penicillium capsulatum]KAJ6135749.1 hypothetical protein N7512_000909 [Penicillium capsulatum]